MNKGETNWLDIYQPFKLPSDFEDQNVTLRKFSFLEEGMIIIASGSPRNRRILKITPDEQDLVQLSPTLMKEKLREFKNDAKFGSLVQQILKYEEPKQQWGVRNGEASDGNLSLNKARVVAASAILINLLEGKQLPQNFSIIARDYNVANNDLKFLDKPGFAIRSGLDLGDGLPKEYPESWVERGSGPEPIDPVTQLDWLYKTKQNGHEMHPFYVANSSVVLECNLSEVDIDFNQLASLIDFVKPLSSWVNQKSENSFMAIKPDFGVADRNYCLEHEDEPSVWSLHDFYSDISLDNGGNLLYVIPGIVDWSRKPFSGCISVSGIENSLTSFNKEMLGNRVNWQRYSEAVLQNQEIEDEMVGISTKALKALLG
jgi:hypothetical protein